METIKARGKDDAVAGTPGGAEARPEVPGIEPVVLQPGGEEHLDTRPETGGDRFLIVGLGSSAGGLKPLEKFFQVENFLKGTPPGLKPDRVENGQSLSNILAILRARTGHDLALYKRNTVLRRVQRRMTVRQVSSIGAYADLLAHNPDEIRALFKEMLIGVTEFFRDPEAFDLLANQVIPTILRENTTGAPVRVWVAACATGEEAYSVAILIREKMAELEREVPVQIFATDLDENAIEVARHGRYPVSIAADVSPERLARFFERADGGYTVAESVRKMIVFAPHSLVKDPPFSHVSLITCRNLLIYLEPELQRSIANVFEYTLDPGGYLLLGASEMLPDSASHFDLVDRRWKLYRRLDGRSHLTVLPQVVSMPWMAMADPVRPAPRQMHLRQHLERALLAKYRPATLVVDPEGRILFTYGQVGRFLQPAPGETGGWHVMQMLRDELRVPVAAGIRHAVQEKQTIHLPLLQVDDDYAVDVIIRRLERPVTHSGLLLVEFHASAHHEASEPLPGVVTPSTPAWRVDELERELQSTKEYLQTVIEELQSSNEELQSANEELETAQEEAQSANEELITLNNELEGRVDELTWVNNDMTNVLANVEVGILFLDRRLQVRRFNRAATRIVNLIPGDVGRPVSHLSSALADEDWVADAQSVFEALTPLEKAVRTQDGRWYVMRVRPYRTVADAIEGVVLTFGDITEQKAAEHAALAAQAVAEGVIQTVRTPLLLLDAGLRVSSANRAFYETFRVKPVETEGQLVYELGDGQWNIPDRRWLLEQIIPENESFDGYEVEHDFPHIGHRRVTLYGRRVAVGDQGNWILLTVEEKS